jgi:hypothetical protein
MEDASHAKKRHQLSTVSRTRVAQKHESASAIGVRRTRVAQKDESTIAIIFSRTRSARNSESTPASNVKLLLAVNVFTQPRPNTKKRDLNSVSKTNKR